MTLDTNFALSETSWRSSVQTWRAAASDQLSGSWKQIWLWHGACPIFLSEPVGMSRNQLPTSQQCHEWSDVDPEGRAVEFVQLFQELCNLWFSVCSSSSTDMWLVLKRVCHWNTCVRLKLFSPKAYWIVVRVSVALFTRLAQNLMHTRCSFLWSIMKIATGHAHDSK